MKRNKILLFVLSMVMMLAMIGCASIKINSPEDAIKDAYGDRKFRVSFDSTNLDTPITDIYYTANNMPILPTPTKVGFVFAGWFFDASLTELCDVASGDLLWKMKDVTLYPKWEEEKIVNNGTYEIEYNAKIIEDSVVEGPMAKGYQKFPENIIESETYIEKNDEGTFLRIQYDNVVRGPVLGGTDANGDNFSKMTYTVLEDDDRISDSLSIQDRTNTIQTIYYDLKDLNLTDTITFHIEYYNWKIDIPDDKRKLTTVRYDVEFNITRFIGFDQSFVNPDAKLEDGIYVVPTHYRSLSKTPSMLDMFNPVYAYIEVKGGSYKLYKPLNSYNNDYPDIKPNEYPLRSSGYAREFACFPIDQNKKISPTIEEDVSGNIYMPEKLGAKEYLDMTYEFHADTGRYYYVIDLGKTLDKDIVFIGGSSGFMESMMSFPFDYRRLSIDYRSMVQIVDWDYKPLSGDEYKYKDRVAFYPGSTAEFDGTNKTFNLFKNYKHIINMTNVFFTKTKNNDVKKVFDTKMTISPEKNFRNPMETKGDYSFFNIEYSAFGYNPMSDGDLFARELSFVTHMPRRFANSFVNEKKNGKTFNIGDTVNLRDLYHEKVSNVIPAGIKYTAFKLDNKLNIIGKGKDIPSTFKFEENVAVLIKGQKVDRSMETALLYIVEKENPSIKFMNQEWLLDEESGLYKTNKKFEEGSFVDIPEVLYTYYGKTYTTKGLKKNFDELKKYTNSQNDQYDKNELPQTDFSIVSLWKYEQGLYTPGNLVIKPEEQDSSNSKKHIIHDFIMGEEPIRILMHLTNQFGEINPIMLEFEGTNAGYYELHVGNQLVDSKNIAYKGSVRKKLDYKMLSSYHIETENDVNNIPTEFELKLVKDGKEEYDNLAFSYATICLKNSTPTVKNINEIWNYIKDENYAIISMVYTNDYGDKVEYKAEYNFRLNNKIADDYYTINNNITIFNGEDFRFDNPIISGYDYTILGNGQLRLYKKYGNSYSMIDQEDGKFYSSWYYSEMNIKTSGSYMICWEFTLLTDQNGDIIFNGVDKNSQSTYIKFGICQEFEVLDRNSEAKLTYATDKKHPFNEDKVEDLISQGYTFSEDENYQYLTVNIRGDKRTFSLTYDVISSPDYVLFGWGDKKGNILYSPDSQVQNIITVQKTLEPILYAVYNVPLEIELEYDFDGVIYKPYNDKIRFNRTDPKVVYEIDCNLFYIDSFFKNMPEELKDYKIYGWKASKKVLSDYIDDENGNHLIYTDQVKSDWNIKFNVSTTFKMTAVFKKSLSVKYEAVEGKPDNNKIIPFMDKIERDNNLFSMDRLAENLSVEKMAVLKNPRARELNLSFKYWTVFDKSLDKWVEVNLDTFVLDDKYSAKVYGSSVITLRAVFG